MERAILKHVPVMVEEVMTCLRCEPGQTYVDGTLGSGGHAAEILKRTGPDGVVIGIEWDEEAIREARKRLETFGERIRIVRENFIRMPEILGAMEVASVDGILLDLGLSSIQLEGESRGFSFRAGGPLDMRMDQRRERKAADWVNDLPLAKLEGILSEFGEERWARRIARAIVSEREKEPIETTRRLRDVVHRATSGKYHSRRIDPATRTFQAFRIQVNEELENLKGILESGWTLLKKGGRICILSFHSLEDRMVKNTFRRLDREGLMHVLTKKPITPAEEERENNPRSRSAKLRCAERV